MRMSGNTFLIKGGGSGIGFCLAEGLVNAGNDVLICGRREAKLKEGPQALRQRGNVACQRRLMPFTISSISALSSWIRRAIRRST